MIPRDYYKTLIGEAVAWSFLSGKVSFVEAMLLTQSVNEPINERRMNEDTRRRLNKRRRG
jgi:hypothetical protein